MYVTLSDRNLLTHTMFSVRRETVWPRGQYALPVSINGCPEEDDSYGWHRGYVNMTLVGASDGNDTTRHYWTNDMQMLGEFIQCNIILSLHFTKIVCILHCKERLDG